MITLTVGLILMLVGVPLFTTTTQNNRVAAASNTLVAHLNLARNEAVKRGVPVTACASTDGATCATLNDWNAGLIVFVDGGTAGSVDGTDQILRVGGGSGDVTLTGSSAFVRYLADGTLSP
jgi:type IV fimbrial biogenesis protein FimT